MLAVTSCLPVPKCWAWPYELPLTKKFSVFSLLSNVEYIKAAKLNRQLFVYFKLISIWRRLMLAVFKNA